MHKKDLKIINPDPKKIPGEVYLCQISETVSCGACCGLYNVADPSRESLTKMLTYRTENFENLPRDMDAILSFKDDIESKENQNRPYPEFHHCPFIGLIGDKRSGVGCLLHPLAKGNKGIDFRGLSYYGGMACNSYFCPTHRYLPRAYKEIIRDVADDWYLYGLVITETKMLTAFFQETEKRFEQPLKKEDILSNKEHIKFVKEFLSLKRDWRFRSHNTPVGNYFFEDNLYPGHIIDYAAAGCSASNVSLQYNIIFQELGSYFKSPDDLHEAENLLNQLFEKIMVFSLRGRAS